MTLPEDELADLRARLEEAEETIEAVRSGRIDAVVMKAGEAHRVYTLEGADYSYRVVLNTMHEGVVTVAEERTIVYCNQRFSDLVGVPCEDIVGHDLDEFVLGKPIEVLKKLFAGAEHEPQVAELPLLCTDGTQTPARFSITSFGVDHTPMFSVLVTDLTEPKRHGRELQEHQKRLRALAGQLADAAQQERQRLAVAIHDEIAQTLGAAKMHTQMLRGNPEAAAIRPALDKVANLIDEAVRQSREIMTELSPPILKQWGLVEGLRWWAAEVHTKHGLGVAVTVEGDVQRLEPGIEAALFAVVKELLQNTIKHAQATSAAIHVDCSETELDIEISDNGVGFAPASIERTEQGGFGLFSVRERIGYLGGTFAVDSAPGKGTRSKISLPLPCNVVATQA